MKQKKFYKRPDETKIAKRSIKNNVSQMLSDVFCYKTYFKIQLRVFRVDNETSRKNNSVCNKKDNYTSIMKI